MHQHTGSIAGNTNNKNELFSPLDNLRKTTQTSQSTKVLDSKLNNATSNHGIYNNHHNTSQYKRYSTSSFASLSSITTSNTMTQPIKPISSINSNEDIKEDRDVEEPRLLDDLQLSEYEEEMIKKALMQQQQNSYQIVQGDKSDNFITSNNSEREELKEKKQASSIFAGNNQNQSQSQSQYHDFNEISPNYQKQRKKKDISLSSVFVPAQGFLSLSLDSAKMKNNGMRNTNGSVHQRNFSTSFINDQNMDQKSVLPVFEKPLGKSSLQQSLHKKSESWSIQRSHINEVDLDGESVEVYDSVQELLNDAISCKLADGHVIKPVEKQPEIVTLVNENTVKNNNSNIKEVLVTPHTSSLPTTKTTKFQFPATAEKDFEYKNESSVSSDDENSVIHNEQFNATHAQSQLSSFKSPKSRKGSFSFGSNINKSITPKKQIGTSHQDYYYYPPPKATSASPSHSPANSSSNTSIHLQPPVFSTPDNKTGNKHHKKKSSTFSIKNIFKSSPKPPSHSHSQSSLATESSIFYDGTATVSNAAMSSEIPRFTSSSPLKKNGFVYYPQQEPSSPPRPPKFVTQTSTASVNSGRKLIESEPIVSSAERIQQAIDLKFQGKLKESTDQLFMACQENDKMAYLLYGLALKFGTGIQRNVFESLKYLKKACGINKKNDESKLFEKYDEIDPYELSLNSAICVPDIPPEPLSPALYEIGILYLKGATTSPSSDISLSSSSGAASDSSIATVKHPSSSFASRSKDSSTSPVFESFLSSKAVHKIANSRDSLDNNSVDDNNFMNNSKPETTKTECVEIDELKALKYLELSASLGNKESILICGSLWSKERPAVHPKDLVRSAAWFRIAEYKGCKLLGSDWIYREKYMLKENSTTIFKKK